MEFSLFLGKNILTLGKAVFMENEWIWTVWRWEGEISKYRDEWGWMGS